MALDLATFDENIALAKKLKSHNIWLKVGLRSYIRDGKSIIDALKDINPHFDIFLDLKLYDIPNTMADTAEVITDLGVSMFNIHASSGKIAMQSVVERIKNHQNKPILLAVTALTSFENKQFASIYGADINTKATQFAKDAYDAKLDGVVCSVYESKQIKKVTDDSFLTLTPGIRPFGESAGDQQRVADLNTAQNNLSDFIVVGRPIYQAKQPQDIVSKILENID